MQIRFFFDGLPPDGLLGVDPDRDWRRFQQGDEAWILQSFLRLRRAGVAVELTAEPSGAGLVVFHAKHKRALLRRLHRLDRCLLVAVRGDLAGSLRLADFQVVQCSEAADGRRRHFIPHWPQPGLQARDERRGDLFATLAYKGFLDNLHPAFRDEEWRRWLAARRIAWVVDAVRFAGGATDREALHWPDFRDLDGVLAVRPHDQASRPKPATKLYNAWLGGTPALLGPEAEYRALRRDELDYLEIDSLAGARAAVTRLAEQPGLRRAMAERGRERAAEFAPQRTLERWRELLVERLPALAASATGSDAAPEISVRRRFLRRVEGFRLSLTRR